MKKRPFSKKQIQTLRKVLIDKPRDLALLNVGVGTVLRGGGLLSLKVSDALTLKYKWEKNEFEEKFYLTNNFRDLNLP